MDPNQALKNARAALAMLRRIEDHPDTAMGGHDRDHEKQEEASGELADAFEALDGRLSKGGFLPLSWQKSAKVSE